MSEWFAWIKRNKQKWLAGLAVLAIVIATVWIYGGNGSQPKDERLAGHTTAQEQEHPSQASKDLASETANLSEQKQDQGNPESLPQATADPKSDTVQDIGSKTGDTDNPDHKDTRSDPSTTSKESAKEEGQQKNQVTETTQGKSIVSKATESSVKSDVTPKDKKPFGTSPSAKESKGNAGEKESKGSNKQDGKSTPNKGVASQPDSKPPQTTTVQLTIVGSTDVGTIMSTEEIEIGDSETVMDVLKKATRAKKIQMDFSGSGATAYVKGIDNLYEFDKGSGSGWMYSINSKFPNRSAGVWPIHPGDHIQWLYTEDLGKDLGAGTDDGLWDGES
ncbi:DUF4430 domain-containing protein [Paenibacillus sp. MER 180]|uniref:DUF4430 domain-containing protein n=1 Tax=Paenibacillus sp. MER 180 TaxID=2939570 RepID=UPI00203EEF29|nr:DUF4430 domain-containing protein [Paenibacillus sp. MER 180]MCM3288847.1 DUF4430 domain-containing protein [Paenibacillus sp. MER 180]